jgi:hypothetical protein
MGSIQKQMVSYWLVPSKHEFAKWKEVIKELSMRFNGPTFEPHVTIYVGPSSPEDSVERNIDSIIKGRGRILLNASRLLFSESFTKSCYIQFEQSEEVVQLCESLRNLSKIAAEYNVNPHMSLFYGNINSMQKKEIEEVVSVPYAVTFDSIWAISHVPKVTRREDVESWHLYCKRMIA